MRNLAFLTAVLGVVGMVGATNFTWLATPENGEWLGVANWDCGVWPGTTSDSAVFDVSSVSEINVNGSVTVAGSNAIAVRNQDYSFTNGTMTINGEFGVGAGVTATVFTQLLQPSSSTRFAKVGNGDLVLKGDETTTNSFYRLGVRGGSLTLDGGTHLVTGASSGAGETQVAGSFGNSSKFRLTDGAKLLFTPPSSSSYLANGGCDMLIDDGEFNCWNHSEFLNGFGDINGTDQARTAQITIRDRGVMEARQIRISKVNRTTAYYTPQYGVINLQTGGVLRVRNFTMDGGTARFTAAMNFDGGVLEFVNTASEKTNSTHRTERFARSAGESTQCWSNVSLNILAGGLIIDNKHNASYLYSGFKSGCEHDGGVTIRGANTFYQWGESTYTGGTHIQGSVWFAIQKDSNVGTPPAEPTTNIFIESSGAVFHFDRGAELHPNRDIWVNANTKLQTGVQNGHTARIHGVIDGPDSAKTTWLSMMSNWPGVLALHPDNDRTNRIGRLLVCGRLDIESGTTIITGNTGTKVHGECGFLISRDGGATTASFSDTQGILTLTGGRLVIQNDQYMQVAGGGKVIVKGGVLDASRGREWLNALGSPGRTVVEGTGEMIAGQVRITQAGHLDGNGEPLASIQVKTGGVLRLNKFWMDDSGNNPSVRGTVLMDGGTLVARRNEANFLGASGVNGKGVEKLRFWERVQARACAGGARIDTAGFTVSMLNPIVSGAEQDGGLTKLGAGTFTLQSTNTYNGVTRLEGGTLVFQHANGFPGGHLDFPAATLAAKDKTTALVTMKALAFRAGSKVRIVDVTDDAVEAMQGFKTVATFTDACTVTPEIVVVDADGNESAGTPWALRLVDGGRTLKIGYVRGTVLTLR